MKKITLLISLTLCINISCSQNARKKEMFSWWNNSKEPTPPPSSRPTRDQNFRSWNCSECTYLNSNMLSYCEMCNSKKPSKKNNQSHKSQKRSNQKQKHSNYTYQNDEKEKDDKKDKKSKEITKLLIKAANAIEKYDNIYNAVLFLGITDSGKSTTINYLLGNKLEKVEKIYERKQDNDRSERKDHDDDDDNDDEKIKEYYYKLSKNEIGPKLGHTILFETLYPEPFFNEKRDFCYCDCPGFEDNRGDAELIANAAGTNSFLKKVKNISGIAFVCEYGSLNIERANGFLKGIIEGINEMFYDSNDLSVFDSMAFLITKAPNFLKAGDVRAKLNKFKNDFIQSNNPTFATSIKYLNAIIERKNNIVIIRLDDKNKKPKTYIEKSIKSFRGISKDKFKFIGGESARFKINNMAEKVLSKLFEPLNYIFYGGPQEIKRLKNENNKIFNKIKGKQKQLNEEKQNNKKKLNDIYSEIADEENDIDDELIDKRNATRSDFQIIKSHKQAEMMMKQEIEITQRLREENIKKQQELEKIDEQNKLIEQENKKIQEEIEDIKEKKRDCEKNLHLNEEKKRNLEKENINVLNYKDDIENIDLKIEEQKECFEKLLDVHKKLAIENLMRKDTQNVIMGNMIGAIEEVSGGGGAVCRLIDGIFGFSEGQKRKTEREKQETERQRQIEREKQETERQRQIEREKQETERQRQKTIWYEKNLKKDVDKSIKELTTKKHLIESLKKKKEQIIRRKNKNENIIKNNKQTLETTINNNKNDLNNKYKNKISSLKSQKKSYKAKKASTIDLTQIKSEIQSNHKTYIANENSKLEQEERNKLDSIQKKINKKKINLKNKKSKKQNELAEELKNRKEIIKKEIKQQHQENANINQKIKQIFAKLENCKQEIKREQETAKMVLTINKYLKLKDDVPKIEEFELLFNKWSNI